MVTGSLLGLAVENGVLEISHSYPLPSESKQHTTDDDELAGLDGTDYQVEMMKLLKDVHVDNNCIGWYQSMYLGLFSTSTLLETQLSYQTDLSPNAIVLLYDPMQTAHGNLVMKCLRLTEECVKINSADKNSFIDPKRIFEEIPVTLSNPSLVKAFLTDVRDGIHNSEGLYDANAETNFDRLDLSTNPYLEKHLEFLSGWVDNLAAEQLKFQYYSRQLLRKDKRRKKDSTDWEDAEAPRRLESLLISNQISSYCDQMDVFIGDGLNKLFLADGLAKK